MMKKVRMQELMEKFASELENHLEYEELQELADELDLSDEELEYFNWSGLLDSCEPDYSSNMPCDNSGMCAGTSCPRYFECKGGR